MFDSGIDKVYQNLIHHVIYKGQRIATRNSDVWRTFATPVKIARTPLISLRKTAWKNALREWEWFMSGSHNINDLHPSVHSWWKPWADKNGYVYYNYSQQFRRWCYGPGLFDQIEYLIEGIRDHPHSRRNVITTWNTGEMADPECPITNCHGTVIQAFVNPDDSLHLVTYQRSVDVICGLPHNWIQYWAFLLWLAYRSKRKVGELLWIGGDVHVYEKHYELATKIRTAELPNPYAVPALIYLPTSEEFKADDFSLDSEYKPLILDRAEMIV